MIEVRRIDLSTVEDIDKLIKDLCTAMTGGGYHLVSTFTYQTQLVLIFQS